MIIRILNKLGNLLNKYRFLGNVEWVRWFFHKVLMHYKLCNLHKDKLNITFIRKLSTYLIDGIVLDPVKTDS